MAKDRDGTIILSLSGKWVSWSHTVVAYSAFFGALIVGMNLHFHKIVKNEHYGYPDEWFPSVSATIGDRHPERSLFQFLIAITSGPRFALVFFWYFLTARPNSFLPKFTLTVGLIRTILCGGWVYVTSTDNHQWHDIYMISYLLFTLPWTLGCLALSPNNARAIKYRKYLAGAFFGTLVPLIYFFIQHKVHKVPGAYTIYAFFEWSLILFDVGFDAVTALDFAGLDLRIVDVKGVSKGRSGEMADYVAEKTKNDNNLKALVSGKFSWVGMIDAIADVYTGFMFWTILTSLGVTIWYFPLWHMGLSGYEVLVMTSTAPYFLGIRPLRRFLTKNMMITSILSLTGLIAFYYPKPSTRLFVTGAGVFFSCLALAAGFFAERHNPARLEGKISAFSIGLIASSIAKFACYSNNPVWPIMGAENDGLNRIGLALGVLAVLWSSRKSTSVQDNSPKNIRKGSSFPISLGLAGLFFGLHSLLSDSSTMITWVWDGFPVTGPLAVPHGAFTFLAMGLGFFIGNSHEGLSRSWPMFAFGCISAAIFHNNHGWWGYYGAFALAIYLTSIIPSFIRTAVQHGPGKTFGNAFFLYNLLVLAHVWTVAYAFVPGGPLLRERTDLVMIMTMSLIGAGVYSTAILSTNSKGKPANTIHLSPFQKRVKLYFLYTLTVLELTAVGIAYMRFPTMDYEPYNKDAKVVSAGIWTVHFGIDNHMWSSERRMRDLIKEMEVDIIGLLESDLQRIIMGNRDMTQFLAEDLGMYADFGPGPNKHTWGAALLSKFPIVNSTHHLLPSPAGELAPAILATIDMYGEMVDVLVFHSGQEEDVEDRRLQSEGIAKLMGDSPRPLILLSYLVTKPHQGNYNTYVSGDSRMNDIDPSDWDRWCEYILYRGIKRVGYARVSRSTITDTELQVGKFVIGDDRTSSDTIISEDQVPEAWRFPARFHGEGVRGHRYHVFNQPRYFA
ncbi:hypothetical protein L211DRAFT_861313 [Terfezia boudieri ATCC MYA-4762]|uniref:Calcofluor white hypersensitive protein n=1 Tax=Terfezia boudieri ATCC MYA-4762 TaxID=1051890 RepID=A0A3N4LRM4_9PEZI|nr:hypothetical protein L211DRAFT_861313 [Terfezia boudieri ATCC MYA-4762]